METKERTRGGRRDGSDDDGLSELIRLAGPRPRLPAEELDSLYRLAHTDWQSQLARRNRRRWLTAGLSVAAAVLAAIGLALLLAGDDFAPSPDRAVAKVEGVWGETAGAGARLPEVGEMIQGGTMLETGGQGRLAVRLADGPALRVDRQTRLQLHSNRRVTLETGALYVDSGAEGAADGLEIRTPFAVAHDIGTQFEIAVGKERIRLRVREGAVRLERGDELYEATAGEELRMPRRGDVERLTVDRHGAAWAWTLTAAPQFDLEGASLGRYLEWLERETGWTVRFEDADLARVARNTILHGSLAGIDPTSTPDVVLPSVLLSYRLEDGILMIEER